MATTSGTTTTTSSIGSLEEVSVTGSTTTTTAYYGGLALSVNGALRYTLSDGLGSVSEAVDAATGAVLATQLYAPYGGVRYQSGTLPTDRGFTGQVSDAATSGLDYYGARYYDPVAGQFTSADTTLAGGLNRYAYVGGNPETRTDPSGHMTRSPDYKGALALGQSQQQPPTATVNQWAAPGSVGGFVTYISQAVLGTDTLRQSYYTLFLDRHASTGDKVKAAVVGGVTLVTDAVTIASLVTLQPEIAEGAREADAAVLAIDDANVLSHGGGDAAGVLTDAGGGCGLSFAASTLVATPQGERTIATLRVGQQVSAYDPTSGKRTTQTIAQVFLNHDSDRLDVTLALPASQVGVQAAAAATHTTQSATAHPTQRQTTREEVIHTTANHPWLTADRGWLVAGALRVGEPVRLLNGGTARVVALRTLPGVGPMWDLALDATHTFAVGDAQAVVHNCGNPQQAFAELGKMRQDLGMGEAGTPGGGTLAKLEVGDQSFYGINAHGQPVDLTVNPISRTHAETDVFQQAANAGVSGGDGNLYVDRDLCGACGRSGAVQSMAKQLGLSSLTVFTPSVPDGVLWLLE